MGGSKGIDPAAVLADLVVGAIIGGVTSAATPDQRGGSASSNAEAEVQRQAEEREARARRAEDRRAEEAVLKAQKQKLAQNGQGAGLAATLGATLGASLGASLAEGDSLAGQSMHGQATIAAPQLKEKLGQ